MYRQQQQQHRTSGGQEQWKSHSPHPPAPVTSWSGHHHHQYHHHPYHSYPAAQQQQQPMHHPSMPPAVHYPPTHHNQHGQYATQYAHQGATRYYHSAHGNHVSAHSPAGPGMTAEPASTRPMQSQHGAPRPMHQPALVSPHHQQNVSANQVTSTPISPQTVTSSSSPVASQRSPAAPALAVAVPPTPAVVAAKPAAAASAGANSTTAPPLPPPLPSKTAPSSSASTNAVPPLPNMNIVTTKPPRPYTEYTMFYQLEREFILHRMLTTAEEAAKNPNSPANNGVALFQNDPLMPARYRSLPLRADWYISGKSKKPTKRKHRKSHGKIGFLELTRLIASRWANVDDETRKYCKMMAAMELVKYKEDMESYNLYKDRLQAIGEMPEDMKERIAKKQKKVAEKKRRMMEADNEKNKNGVAGAAAGALMIKAEPVGSSTKMATTHKTRITTDAAGTGSINQVLPAPSRPIVKLEPIAHNSPIMQESSTDGINLDNDMEKFISSLVQSPGQPQGTKKMLLISPGANSKSKSMTKKTTAKTVTPERSNKKRKLFRDRPSLPTRSASGAVSGVPPLATSASARAAEEILVPLKDDGESCLEGIPLTFSGIDENEIAREFKVNSPSSSPRVGGSRKMEPQMSYDYWDALIESTEL